MRYLHFFKCIPPLFTTLRRIPSGYKTYHHLWTTFLTASRTHSITFRHYPSHSTTLRHVSLLLDNIQTHSATIHNIPSDSTHSTTSHSIIFATIQKISIHSTTPRHIPTHSAHMPQHFHTFYHYPPHSSVIRHIATHPNTVHRIVLKIRKKR